MPAGYGRMIKIKTDYLSKGFGITVARLRKKKALTQETLAFEAALTRPYISMVERGKASPTLNTIHALAQILGTDAAQLVQLALQESLVQERAHAGLPPLEN